MTGLTGDTADLVVIVHAKDHAHALRLAASRARRAGERVRGTVGASRHGHRWVVVLRVALAEFDDRGYQDLPTKESAGSTPH